MVQMKPVFSPYREITRKKANTIWCCLWIEFLVFRSIGVLLLNCSWFEQQHQHVQHTQKPDFVVVRVFVVVVFFFVFFASFASSVLFQIDFTLSIYRYEMFFIFSEWRPRVFGGSKAFGFHLFCFCGKLWQQIACICIERSVFDRFSTTEGLTTKLLCEAQSNCITFSFFFFSHCISSPARIFFFFFFASLFLLSFELRARSLINHNRT